MKKVILDSLSKLPLIQNYFTGIIVIFMLHRVHPFELNKLSPNENMKVSPDFLEKFIVELRSKGYEFISLDRVHEILQNHEKVKKQIVFTLDDGYKDNYEIAYPIFKKYNIPFTVYITTSFPENRAVLWWYALEDLLIKHDEIVFGGEKYSCRSIDKKNDLFLQIRNVILKFKKENLQEKIDEFFQNYQINWEQKCKELCMNWAQIVELSKDELCTIAGHTNNHYVFKRLSQAEIIDEILEANRLIELNTGKVVEHFAYPFGGRIEVGKREFQIIKELGFKTVTTTRNGTIFKEHLEHLESLPRVMLVENFSLDKLGQFRRSRVVTV